MLGGFEITYYNSDDSDDYFMNIVDKIFNNLINYNKILENTTLSIFETYLINEYCTSKLCNHCHQELDKILIRKSQKPAQAQDIKKNKSIIVNGLLRHQDVNSNEEQEQDLVCIAKCAIYHNRDKNAVQNMISIVEELKNSGKRPLHFTRENVEAI